ncbi:hypothetical protein PV387_26885 [Streptomyces sp. ME02-6987-2C]|nr:MULTISPECIES: hypothetical protein [unclassified Streptomyces]MDX3369609.1 hypothetical protein [Streptomyces sp. ME02-6987-2C]MDX3427024.1 hypothetical protein [Streptomyces sp. ME02-6985-2c]
MDKLVEDELAEEVDGQVYLPRHLADGEGLRPDPHQLEPVALTRGTADLGERRRKRHGDQRRRYRQWLTERTQHAARSVEPGEHLELGHGLVCRLNGPQRVRHCAGGVCDDIRIAGVGLGLTRVEVGDPPHRQAREIGDAAAGVTSHGQRQGTAAGLGDT